MTKLELDKSRKTIYAFDLRLSNYLYGEFSIEELVKKCNKEFKLHVDTWEKRGEYRLAFYKLEHKYDYDDSYIAINIYRYETDKEVESRLIKEEKLRLSEESRKKSLAKTLEKKKKAEGKLEKDPEYKKFLELKKKFDEKIKVYLQT